jgi:hypothetical protein
VLQAPPLPVAWVAAVRGFVNTLRDGCLDGGAHPHRNVSGGRVETTAQREQRARSVMRMLPEMLPVLVEARQWVHALEMSQQPHTEEAAEATHALWSCLVDVTVAGAAAATAGELAG